MFTRNLTLYAVAIAACAATTFADDIILGTGNGLIIGRDEFNVLADAGFTTINYGHTIGAIDERLSDRVIALGLDHPTAFQGNFRGIDDLNFVPPTSSFGAGSPILSVAVRPDGHIAFGTENGAIYMQNGTNLLTSAPGYTGTLNGITIFATALNDMDTFPDGDLLIAGQSGQVFVRDRHDTSKISTNLAAFGETFMNFGGLEPITAVAVTPSGNMVIGRGNGGITVRSPTNPSVDIAFANFGGGAPIQDVDVFPDGRIVIGLGDGSVDIRHETNLTVSLDSITLGGSVDAVQVTSNGNIWMGTSSFLVFARSGTNLLTQVGGTDGVNFDNSPITALAAFPDPVVAAVPAFESITTGTAPDTVVVQWSSETGRVYTVQESTDLVGGSFSNVANGIPPDGASTVYTADAPHAAAALQVISDPAP